MCVLEPNFLLNKCYLVAICLVVGVIRGFETSFSATLLSSNTVIQTLVV